MTNTPAPNNNHGVSGRDVLPDLPRLTDLPRPRNHAEATDRLNARAAAALAVAENTLRAAERIHGYGDDPAAVQSLLDEARLYLAEYHAIDALRVR